MPAHVGPLCALLFCFLSQGRGKMFLIGKGLYGRNLMDSQIKNHLTPRTHSHLKSNHMRFTQGLFLLSLLFGDIPNLPRSICPEWVAEICDFVIGAIICIAFAHKISHALHSHFDDAITINRVWYQVIIYYLGPDLCVSWVTRAGV